MSVTAAAALGAAITNQMTNRHMSGSTSSAAPVFGSVQISGAGYSGVLEIPDVNRLCPNPPAAASYDTGLTVPASSVSTAGYVQPCVRLKVGAAGDTRPDAGANPVTVSINGHLGLFGTAPPIDAHDQAASVASVIWQVVPTRWVVLQGGSLTNQTRPAELALAELIDGIGASSILSRPLDSPSEKPRFPYALTFIPQPVRAEWGTTGADITGPAFDGIDIGVGSVNVADYRSEDHRTMLTTQLWGPGGLPGVPPQSAATSTPVVVRGSVAHVGVSTIDLVTGAYHLRLRYTGPRTTRNDLLRIARGIRLPAHIENQATWFRAADLAP